MKKKTFTFDMKQRTDDSREVVMIGKDGKPVVLTGWDALIWNWLKIIQQCEKQEA